MKVGIISSYPPARDAVSMYYCPRLCRTMLAMNSNVRILVASNAQPNQPEDGNRIKVVKVWSNRSLLSPLRILRMMMHWKPDVIDCQHEFQLYGRGIYRATFSLILLILKIMCRPIVVTMHHVPLMEDITSNSLKKYSLGRLRNLIALRKALIFLYMKIIGLLASRIIVHSRIAKDILTNEYRFDKKKIIVLHQGLDIHHTNIQSEIQAKERLCLSDRKIILFFGEIRRSKGLEYAIRAMAKVSFECPEALLVVAGDYNPQSPESKGYLQEIVALVRDLNLDKFVVFTGFVSERDLPTFFTAADAVLLPYLEDGVVAASGPLSIAIGFAKPIIATKVKKFLDLKDKENALIVPPADSDSLAEAIISLVKEPELRQKLSVSTVALASSSSWEKITDQYLALYGELVGRPNSTPTI